MTADILETLTSIRLLGVPVHVLKWAHVRPLFEFWVNAEERRQITVFNVHSLMTTRQDAGFLRAVCASDLVICDSVPLMWYAWVLGENRMERVAGPDLCVEICRWAEDTGRRVFFMGSSPLVLKKIEENLHALCPRLKLAGTYSPPMKSVFSEEDLRMMREAVNRQPVDVLWVGLTAPKQEKWILENLPHLRCKVAVGIGAAFEFLAGTKTRAPRWVQRSGLEWFHRLCQEPRRLWRRYLLSNVKFLFLVACDVFRRSFSGGRGA